VVARTGVLKNVVQIEAAGEQARSAGVVVAAMAGEGTDGVVLSFPDGRTVALPAALVDVVRATAGELANGHTVTVLPAETVLTPAEAGQLLGLSRPFVVRLLDDGEIPSERLPRSRHRRVLLSDVLAFNARRDQRREGRRRIADTLSDAELSY
jgi:excisionase family DNA binding protein